MIVTFQSADVLDACLRACMQQLPPRAEVVVVDNASDDSTTSVAGRWPQVQVIANRTNRGFAAACNQGIAATTAPFVLLLNPDAELLTGLDAMVATGESPSVGAVGGMLLDHAGQYQAGFAVRRLPTPLSLAFEVCGINRLWPGNPVNRRYRCDEFDPTIPADVEQPAGALLLLRRQVWEHLGGLDESYHPLWFEDVDYCARLRAAGYTVRYTPDVRARHQGAHSAGTLTPDRRPLYWYSNLLRYAVRRFHPAGAKLVCVAVGCGAALRLVYSVVQRKEKRALGAYSKVVKLAWCYLRTRAPGGSPAPAVRPSGDAPCPSNDLHAA